MNDDTVDDNSKQKVFYRGVKNQGRWRGRPGTKRGAGEVQ